jgi:hypothetical protein
VDSGPGRIRDVSSASSFRGAFSTGAFGLPALEDQQYAGLLLWVSASIPYVADFLYQMMILLQRSSDKVVQVKF